MIRLTFDHQTRQIVLNSTSGDKQAKEEDVDISPKNGEQLLTLKNSLKKTNQVQNKKKYFGRSAYICLAQTCLESAFKTNKIKHALEGRKTKGKENSRKVAWPLEAQLIEVLRKEYTLE
jgi:predicted RNA-binding protein YlxR (DUF448 family)